MKALKINLFIISMALSFFCIALFAPLFLFAIVILLLLYDYFVLLGGNLYWLNRIIDDKDFHGTGIYRRMLAVDAKMILIAILSGLLILFFTDRHISNINDLNIIVQHHISVFDYMKTIKEYGEIYNFTKVFPLFILTFFIKMFMFGQLTHSIHHIIINEKLTGMKFSGYAPLTTAVQKYIKWARK